MTIDSLHPGPEMPPSMTSQSSPPATSVVVCTRDRSQALTSTCQALLDLETPSGGWEVLIVDNGSRDDTPAVARRFADAAPGLVRIVEERSGALSVARNTGFRQARGELVAYLDDDAIPEPQWLSALVEVLRQDGVLVAGGPVEPLFDAPPPPWVTPFLPYLSAWDRGTEIHELAYAEYPRGANMGFRREVFERFGGFSPRFGRRPGSLLSCEEIELCLRVERGGGRILYAPSARVRHRTPASRVTPLWLERRFGAQGQSEALLEWRHAAWRGLARGMWRRLRDSRPTPGNGASFGQVLADRCRRSALRGYLRGALTAPWWVPRYRARGGEAAVWLP